MTEHVEVPRDRDWVDIKKVDGITLGRFAPGYRTPRECCRGKYYLFRSGVSNLPWIDQHGELCTAMEDSGWLYNTQEEAEEALALYLLRQSGG